MSMFKKRERLTRAEFTTFFKHGKRYHSPNFTLIYAPTESQGDSGRVAVVVSKKVSKSAVKRNRIRRKVYSLLFQCSKGIKTPFGVCIVLVKPGATLLSKAKLQEEFFQVVKKVSIC